MFAFEPGFGIVEQPYGATRHLAISIGAGHQKIYLDWSLYLSDQIAQKDETALEESEHQQLTLRVCPGDLVRELLNLCGDRRLGVDDGFDRKPSRAPDDLRCTQHRRAAPPCPGRGRERRSGR